MKSKKKIIKSIRNSFQYFNYNTLDISDCELEKAINRMFKTMSKFGITTKECLNNLNYVK